MTDPHIAHLPNEILCEIAGYVNDEDLLSLRLSARVFQYITADSFATAFFKDRAYELSPKGLKALVKITEHPVFAPHIRTVIIGHGGKCPSAKYHALLEEAFKNLAIIGNAISIGLRRVCTSHNYEPKIYLASHRMADFFEAKMLAAAIRAQMPLQNLVADIQTTSQNRSLPSISPDWPYSLSSRFSRGDTAYSHFDGMQIKSDSKNTESSKSGEILINMHDKRLKGTRVDTEIWDPLPFYWSRHFLNNLREIHLENCEVCSLLLMNTLVATGNQLESLVLYGVRLRPFYFDTWQSVFRQQVLYYTGLKSCRLGKLWSGTGSLWLEGGDKTIKASTRAQVVTVLSNLAADIRTFTLDD
ncbi:hypothetical protein E4T48_00291 [Aureobasidium sp. EXF-10727]|nr:hypothetical protein E4T48_00291 [Aureobasidium sp. EXF-10727]